MNKKEQLALEMAKKANTIQNVDRLLIPILEGFKIVKQDIFSKDSNSFFVAMKNNTIEQFQTDGELNENESFEQRIDKVIKDIKDSVKNNELYKGNNDYIVYYKNYDNNFFDFKIYVQDILVGSKDDLKFIRQMNAFFVEGIGNEFCQLSLAAGQYKVSDKYKLLKDIKEYSKDEIIKGLEQGLKVVLDNIIYKDSIKWEKVDYDIN